MLRRLGGILKSNTRRGDLAARYGGEEFAFIGVGASLEEACASAERLRQKVAATQWSRIQPGLTVTVSIGVAHVAQADGLAALLALADARLYRAKRGGRDRVVWD